jgi:hypothetical protein
MDEEEEKRCLFFVYTPHIFLLRIKK